MMTNNKTWKIEDAQTSDIPALVVLLNTLFSIEQDFTPDAEQQTKGLRLIIERPNHGVIKVVRDASGDAVGMVSVQLVISSAQGAPSAWVEDMVVAQAYRAQGLGRQLLTSALQWAKQHGATRAQLLVDTSNEPALGYYQHLGWEHTHLSMRRVML